MISVIQRVSRASVSVNQTTIARIEQGLLALIGIHQSDHEGTASRLIEKILHYRVFSDDDGKMNLSLIDIAGGLLLVPQFTLVADTQKGRRPSFTTAASPKHGKALFQYIQKHTASAFPNVQSGEFGANMQVSLINDGPVTFTLTCQ